MAATADPRSGGVPFAADAAASAISLDEQLATAVALQARSRSAQWLHIVPRTAPRTAPPQRLAQRLAQRLHSASHSAFALRPRIAPHFPCTALSTAPGGAPSRPSPPPLELSGALSVAQAYTQAAAQGLEGSNGTATSVVGDAHAGVHSGTGELSVGGVSITLNDGTGADKIVTTAVVMDPAPAVDPSAVVTVVSPVVSVGLLDASGSADDPMSLPQPMGLPSHVVIEVRCPICRPSH